MTSECYNCERDQGGEEGDEPIKLKLCRVAKCENKICAGGDARDCYHRRVCEGCQHSFCEDHVKYCAECDGPWCKECMRFTHDDRDMYCNTCFKRLSRNLEPKTEFSESEDCDADNLNRSHGSTSSDETIEDESLTDNRVKFYDELRDIYLNNDLLDFERRHRIFNLCIREWQQSIPIGGFENRGEPNRVRVSDIGQLLPAPEDGLPSAKRSRKDDK